MSVARKFASASRLIASALVAVFLVASVAPASASPITDKQAQAAAVQRQIDSLTTKAEVASENFNAANARYGQLTNQVQATEKQIRVIQSHQKKLQGTLDTRASALYRQGPLGLLPVLLNARDFSDFDATWQMLVNMGKHDADTVSALKKSKADAQAAHTRLVVAQTEAGQQQRAMAAAKAAVNTHLSQQKALLASVNADIRTLVIQKQQEEAALAAAQAAAFLAQQRRAAEIASSGSYGHSSGGGGGPAGGLSGASYDPNASGGPPPSARGAAAVYWAEKALGKPYVWAASGPNAFDCSGLTMWAYKHVGVNLPHYSGAQIDVGSRVSKSNLEPGDLVFFGSPIHHVGMYVGGGRFIEAPYTGANVRISRLSNRDDFAGACRP